MARYLLFCILWILFICSYHVDCATTSTKGREERIVGGTVSPIIPWLASVRMRNNQGSYHTCGGFIINTRWVGTAAQCLTHKTINNTVISVGSTSIAGGTIYEIEQIVVHNNYNEYTLVNDVAIVRTVEQIRLSASVTSIPLGTNNNFIGIGAAVTINGWGITFAGNGLNPVLHQAVFNVLSNEDCVTRFSNPVRMYITDQHICTQTNGRATCQGDAGGPIVLNGVAVGIVSWVEPCVSGQTNVNTRVSSYVNWILGFTRADD